MPVHVVIHKRAGQGPAWGLMICLMIVGFFVINGQQPQTVSSGPLPAAGNAQAIATLNRLIEGAAQFEKIALAYLQKFTEAEQRYLSITAQVQGYLFRDRELRHYPDPTGIRGQLHTTMLQATNATDQLHNAVQSMERDFSSNLSPVPSKFTEAEQWCNSSKATDLQSSCVRFSKARSSFMT